MKAVECGSIKNVELAQADTGGLDPRGDAGVSGVWGINANTGDNNQNVIFGSMVFNVLNGNGSSAGLDIGGYDYHGNNRGNTNQRDNDAGALAGRVLETAAVMGKRVFLFVTSDGSVSSNVSDTQTSDFRGDRGSAGMTYMIAFCPNGSCSASDFQLGGFNDAQAADDSFITGGTPEVAAAAVFANYLNFSNQLSRLDQVLPGVFTTEDKNRILKIFG